MRAELKHLLLLSYETAVQELRVRILEYKADSGSGHLDDPDGDRDDRINRIGDLPPIPGRKITFTASQLQAKYKHAPAFGFPKNYNPQLGKEFGEILRNFVNNPQNEQAFGTFHGQNAVHYLNRETGMNVITYSDGTYWSNFILNDKQLPHWPKLGGGN